MKTLPSLRSQPSLTLGVLIALAFLLIAIAAPLLAPQQPVPNRPGMTLPEGTRYISDIVSTLPQPPGPEALLGTLPISQGNTVLHQDVFSALVWGCRSALRFGLIVALSAAVLGTIIGVSSGYVGRTFGWLLMRVTDSFLAFPIIAGLVMSNQLRSVLIPNLQYSLVIIPVQLPLGLEVLLSLEFLLIVFTWMPYARLVNALVLGMKSMEFVEAARAIGSGKLRILFRHILPNSLPPIVVLLSRDIGAAVLIQAALAFVHLRMSSSWGIFLYDSRSYVIGLNGNPFLYWWVFVPICLAILLFGLGWSMLGDGLNERLNPHRRRV